MSNRLSVSNTSWAAISFGTQALMGLILNFGLMWGNSQEALGSFNFYYAFFVLLGQAGALGVQETSLKHVSQHHPDDVTVKDISRSAMGLVSMSSGLVAFCLFVMSFLLDHVLAPGLRQLALAIFLFSLNKVGMAILNGRHHFKSFALLQALRSILLVCSVYGIVLSGYTNVHLSWAFLFTETVLFCTIFFLLLKDLGHWFRNAPKKWRDLHFADGVRLLPHCLLSEAFLRIDVLMLSFFVNLEILGRYSFVAFCAEGILQLPYFIKNMVTPQLARHIFHGERTEIHRTALKASLISLSLTLVLTISLTILFPIGLRMMGLTGAQAIYDWWKILAIGVVIYSITVPVENILYLLGFPKLQSVFLAAITSVNVFLNLMFIPDLGAGGAAMATTLSFLSGAVILPVMAFILLRKQTRLT